MNSPRHPACDEFMRMPLCEAVLEHIRSCSSCRSLVNELANDVNRRALEYRHRN
jgi:predicted anti-sigma-YlaC factor YlaD